jgi:hypothetical protein
MPKHTMSSSMSPEAMALGVDDSSQQGPVSSGRQPEVGPFRRLRFEEGAIASPTMISGRHVNIA